MIGWQKWNNRGSTSSYGKLEYPIRNYGFPRRKGEEEEENVSEQVRGRKTLITYPHIYTSIYTNIHVHRCTWTHWPMNMYTRIDLFPRKTRIHVY